MIPGLRNLSYEERLKKVNLSRLSKVVSSFLRNFHAVFLPGIFGRRDGRWRAAFIFAVYLPPLIKKNSIAYHKHLGNTIRSAAVCSSLVLLYVPLSLPPPPRPPPPSWPTLARKELSFGGDNNNFHEKGSRYITVYRANIRYSISVHLFSWP